MCAQHHMTLPLQQLLMYETVQRRDSQQRASLDEPTTVLHMVGRGIWPKETSQVHEDDQPIRLQDFLQL